METAWVPVVGYEGAYEVSDTGHVRNTKTGRILRPFKTGTQRPGAQRHKVTLRGVDFDVAVLVLTAFVTCRPEGSIVMHLNDDSGDNRLCNLRWGTHTENIRDSVAKGRRAMQKLMCADKRVIVEMRDAGVPGKEVAQLFGISPQRVCDVYKGRSFFNKG